MLRTALTVLALCAACAPVLPDDAAPAAAKRSGLEARDRNPAVRAQDDFFRHANGGWLAAHPIPDDKIGWGVFNMVDEATRARVRGIVEAARAAHPAPGSEAQKIADLYASYVDEARIEALGLQPLAAEMDRVAALSDKAMLPALVARWQQLSVTVPFHIDVHQDAKDATQYVVDLQQDGLGLPDRDYYLKDDDQRLVDIRGKYLAHVQAMLRLAGDADAERSARDILALETALARVQWTGVENRDPVKTYNRLSLADLATLTPGFDWQAWMAAHGIAGKADALVVSQPSYLAGFAKVLKDTPLATWKT